MFSSFFGQDEPPMVEMDDTQIVEIIVEEEAANTQSGTATATATSTTTGDGSATSLQAQTDSATTSPNSATSASWQEAHTRYCRTHGRIRASIQQILSTEFSLARQRHDFEIPWSLPTKETAVTDLSQFPFHGTPSASTSSSTTTSAATASSSIFSWTTAKRLVQAMSYGASGSGNDTDYDHQQQQLQQQQQHQPLSWDQDIVNVELVKECLSCIQKRIQQQFQSSSHSSLTTPMVILTTSEWTSWVQQATEDVFSSLPANVNLPLSPDDATWLLQLLYSAHSESQYPKAIQLQRSGKPTLVLLHLDNNNNNNNNNNNSSSNKNDATYTLTLDTHVALYDIQQSKASIEQQLDRWATLVKECYQKAKALHSTSHPQTKLALVHMARAKRYQHLIDTTSTGIYLQLEQLQVSLETAHTNQTMVQLLQQGTKLLHTLSEQTSLEHVEQVQNDLQHEQEIADRIHSELISTTSSGGDEDDEDLLAELAQLTLEDSKTENDKPPTQELDKATTNVAPTTTRASLSPSTSLSFVQTTPALTPVESTKKVILETA